MTRAIHTLMAFAIGILPFLISAQNPNVTLSKLELKAKPMIQRSDLYRAVETPQINALKSGYLVSYTDENYNGHLLFLGADFQLKKDIRLHKSGIVQVTTSDHHIALLRCKYIYQKEKVGPYNWEHNLFFDTYNLDGVKQSSKKLVGDKTFVKGHKNRTYRSNYESALIEHKGTHFAAFEYQFSKTRKYDSKNHMLVMITPDGKVSIINSLYRHVRQVQLLVSKDTLYHIYNQSRGPRAIVMQKYSLAELAKDEMKEKEVGNTGKDVDRILTIFATKQELYPITDGTDKNQFLCRDDLIPVRMESSFIKDDTLNLVLTSMQGRGRRSYDILLARYSLNGDKVEERPLASHKTAHETSAYVCQSGDRLQLVYKTLDERNRVPDTTNFMVYNLKTKAKQVESIPAVIGVKPVFQFPKNHHNSSSKLYRRDFRINTLNYNHYNYKHLNTADGMVILNWDENGMEAVRIGFGAEQGSKNL